MKNKSNCDYNDSLFSLPAASNDTQTQTKHLQLRDQSEQYRHRLIWWPPNEWKCVLRYEPDAELHRQPAEP